MPDDRAQSQDAQKQDIVVSCSDVAKSFDGRTVLDSISLDIRRSETMVVMGGSGSGKSTLLRLMIGSFRPDRGSISILGTDVCKSDAETLDEVRKRFGILFQSGALFNSMTLYENVALPIQEHTDLPPNLIDIQVRIKLELVGLLEHESKYPSQISGGMKKRAGLARALALDPEILFYDEPSAGLDPVTSAQIDQLIISLSRRLGVTSVVITHEMDSAFAIADRMAMLDRGRMIAVESRDWFDAIRKSSDDQATAMSDRDRLIRQFLRGDAEGPITTRANTGLLERQLLGDVRLVSEPSIRSTRG